MNCYRPVWHDWPTCDEDGVDRRQTQERADEHCTRWVFYSCRPVYAAILALAVTLLGVKCETLNDTSCSLPRTTTMLCRIWQPQRVG